MVVPWNNPQIIHFNGIFHSKPSSYGVCPFMETLMWGLLIPSRSLVMEPEFYCGSAKLSSEHILYPHLQYLKISLTYLKVFDWIETSDVLIFACSEFKFGEHWKTPFRHPKSDVPEPQTHHDSQVSQALLEIDVIWAQEVLDQMWLGLQASAFFRAKDGLQRHLTKSYQAKKSDRWGKCFGKVVFLVRT